MDGFYTTNGKTAIGYYKSSDLPYYYSLFPQFTLCANYFCGVLSETYPNHLVLYSGTTARRTTPSSLCSKNGPPAGRATN
jgi:phospholipase C